MLALIRAVLVIGVLYGGSYAVFRLLNAERWDRDGQTYVIFPESGMGRILYLAWRPLSRLDETLTSMRTHIGPHRI